MYGHLFFKSTTHKQIEFLNKELSSGAYSALDDLALSIYIDIEDLRDEMLRAGYTYLRDVHQFVPLIMDRIDEDEVE